MRSSIKIALIALAVGDGSLAAGVPAMAESSVTISTPGIAFGYNDGYWDRGHAWHAWENPAAMTTYRTTNTTHYYDYKHDRDADQGWRDKDTGWWDKH